jgi:integrase/recombinase XerD
MALLILCKSCRMRIKDAVLPCPECGSVEQLFYSRIYPDGRRGRQMYIPLDESIRDINQARSIDESYRAAALESRRPGISKETLANVTFEDLTPEYLRWIGLHRTVQTCRERDYSMKYINKIIGNVPVAAFNEHHISLVQATRKAQGVSNKTINKELYYIMGFLKWAREEKEMAVRSVKLKKLPYSRPLPIVLSPGEVSRILEAADPFYRAFILCLYTLGLRFSEAANLKWEDIDFENMAARCRQKGGTFKILPMHARLKTALEEIGTPDMGTYVFLSRRTGRPIVNVRRAIKRICRKAGITKRVHPHLFRHSSATAMMAGGVNMRIIQQMLGHAQVSTTEWYSHVAMEHLREAESVIEAGIKKGGSRRMKLIKTT